MTCCKRGACTTLNRLRGTFVLPSSTPLSKLQTSIDQFLLSTYNSKQTQGKFKHYNQEIPKMSGFPKLVPAFTTHVSLTLPAPPFRWPYPTRYLHTATSRCEILRCLKTTLGFQVEVFSINTSTQNHLLPHFVSHQSLAQNHPSTNPFSSPNIKN